MSDNSIKKLLDIRNKLEETTLKRQSESINEMLFKLNRLYSLRNDYTLSPDSRLQLENQIRLLEDSIPKMNVIDLKQKYADLSDKELLKFANDFLDLSPEDLKKLHIGSGAFKDTYDIPGTGYVFKKAGGSVGTEGAIIKDYLANKLMEDSFPAGVNFDNPANSDLSAKIMDPEWKKQFLERPNLIVIPEKEPILIQKKLLNVPHNIEQKFIKTPTELKKDYVDNLIQIFKRDFVPQDLHGGNLGIDTTKGKAKAFDAMSSDHVVSNIWKLLPKFEKDIYRLNKGKVFRTVAPLLIKGALIKGALAKGATAAATGLASLAVEAADATEEASELEEAAMMRERKQREFRKKVGDEVADKMDEDIRSMHAQDLIDPSKFKKLRERLR